MVKVGDIPERMIAVRLLGHGGPEMLRYDEDVAVPLPSADEVLIRVAAAGVNNTDINTRIGWYSKGVTGATDEGGSAGFGEANDADAGWAGIPISFPRIQGADCCGHIVSVGANVARSRIGERVIVRSMMRSYVDYRPFGCSTLGSEHDGAFAQFLKIHANEAYAVKSDLSDVELGAIPCAFSTAEGLLYRAGVVAGERVLVTGASGGVGSSAVLLAKLRGAYVIAVAGSGKADAVRAIGADEVVDRGVDLVEAIGANSVDVVIDLVAGSGWGSLLDILRVGGRYAVSGAIAGPIVDLDVRTLYLKDLSLFGCTFQDDIVFRNLVGYIESGELRPVIAKVFPLRDIGKAQEEFLRKEFIGKIVLVPPE